MRSFEDWLEWCPSPALKELAGGGEALRPLRKPEVLELIRRTPAALEACRRSWRVEADCEEWMAAQDYWELRDRKIRYGLVD